MAHHSAVIRINHVDIRRVAVALQSGGRNEVGVFDGSYEQACVDKLIWKQFKIAVGELCADLYGAGAGVDLVVESEQGTYGQLCAVATV